MTAAHLSAPSPASIGRRIGAFAIDTGVMTALAAVLAGALTAVVMAGAASGDVGLIVLIATAGWALVSLALLAWWLVYSAMQGGRGSIGQRALGLRLQDAASTQRIGFWRAVLRNLVWSLAGSIVVGYFTPLFDSSPRRQGWHDMAARAVVVDVRGAGPNPGSRAEGAAAVPSGWPAASSAPAGWPVPAAAPAPAVSAGWHAAPAPGGGPAPAAPSGGHAAPSGWQVAPAPIPPAPSAPTGWQAAPAPAGWQAAPAPSMVPSPPPTAAVPPAPSAPPAQSAAPATMPVAVPAAARPAVASPTAAPTLAPAPTAAPAPSAAPAPAALAEHVHATRVAASVAPPAQRAALYPDAPVLAVLAWDDGTRMAVYGRTLYGRNPAAEEGAVTVAVRDETLSLSKTHFEIGADERGPFIADRHSTNGTVLVRDGGRHGLVPGVRTTLRDADRLELGDRSLTVGLA